MTLFLRLVIMKQIRKTSFTHVSNEELVQRDEIIVVETHLELWVENMQIVSFDCSPGLERELILGYLISSGVLKSSKDIESLEFEGTKCIVCIKRKSDFVTRLLGSMVDPKDDMMQISTDLNELSLDDIFTAERRLRGLQHVHEQTGGAHAALITELSSNKTVFAEDVGRFNAVDKVIGIATESGLDISSSFLLVTGRLTSGMVSKGARSGLPCVASLAVATDVGIQTAINSGMTLIGSIKSSSFWIYNEGVIKIRK
ncbi:MAG: formate dehydrogenase accessory sulfurtransferase FdhD [Candidatus Thorarchaeota archaeon]